MSNLPSGAIPRFPVWEVVVMVFVSVYGIGGILTVDGPSTVAVLGEWSNVWNSFLILCGVITLISLITPAPNGLVINLAAMIVLAASASSVVVAVAIYNGRPLFPGSTSLYIFAFGAMWRSGQLVSQLIKLNKTLSNLVKETE